MDFFKICTRVGKNKNIEVYPEFIYKPSKDIMIRGKAFMAIYDPDTKLWSTKESDVQRIVDAAITERVNELQKQGTDNVTGLYMMYDTTGSWKKYRDYLSRMYDMYVPLDNAIIFSNQELTKESYASHTLPYALEDGDYSAWDELVGKLYSEDERRKIEWSIGSIVSGDSKNIQKFVVFYGAPGSGKSTILNIIEKLFQGYTATFNASDLVSRSNQFSTEAFRNNPLVAIQQDGDLSRIEDNSTLNSIISHDTITIKEKYKPSHDARINAFLFMASNKPVMITDARSGIIRRLIDIHPSGNKIKAERYQQLMTNIEYQLGGIAKHCLDIYQECGFHYYDAYRPVDMMEKTDVLYNFVEESYFTFKDSDYVTLQRAWQMYKEYADDAKIRYVMPRYKFRDELKEYFTTFLKDTMRDGKHLRNVYTGFKYQHVATDISDTMATTKSNDSWIFLKDSSKSLFDETFSNCLAQYANNEGIPNKKWANVKTYLSDLDTTKIHYVKLPSDYIVIDFDLKNENGEKSLAKNVEAASKWPETYAEVSKSGSGIHLHYKYSGDVERLSSVYSENIEIKKFTGNSSLRRKLTKCNDIPIAEISSGLPLKGDKKVINTTTIENEKHLRTLILKALRKEIHGATKPNIDFIDHILNEAHDQGMHYDVTDMRQAIFTFAANSTHQAEYCIKKVSEMKFASVDRSDPVDGDYADDRLVFFDIEVFPNLFLVNWKFDSDGKWHWNEDRTKWICDDISACTRMINPSPEEIGELFKYKLVGFNNKHYDNHILYARWMGYNNDELYRLSQRIIGNSRNGMFGEAYNLSYTDVYDFLSSGHRSSLKKIEIKLGLHHQELGLPWNEPVPEERWSEVAEYCDNDVISTEAAFHFYIGDFKAREILAALTNSTPNDSTNSLTEKFIFGKEKHPPLVYTDLATGKQYDRAGNIVNLSKYPNTFEGYKYDQGKNLYRGEDVGRGGYVFATPGMYGYSITLDVASMHPHSIIAMNLFGEYTERFEEIVNIRMLIKHKKFDEARKLFNGALAPYLNDPEDAANLSGALKTAINSVYGLTSASFDNPFHDNRNKNNIVALRGALFMVNLKHEVQDRGFTVIHIKTDSIKIANPTDDIIKFCIDYGHKYGYDFETEAVWDKICLVNHAVLIGKNAPSSPGWNPKKNPSGWTAVGAQFAQPYVFKTIFSHEKINFDDMCVTKEVKSPAAMYLDLNEDLPDGEHNYIYVGRNGRFTPIISGHGGGVLYRKKENEDKYNSVTGTKGYRWLESEYVIANNKENDADKSYFDELVNEAIHDISEFGDYEWFVGDDSDPKVPWTPPCGDTIVESCLQCPHFQRKYELCDLGFDISEVLMQENKYK